MTTKHSSRQHPSERSRQRGNSTLQTLLAVLILVGGGWLGYAFVLDAPEPPTTTIAIGHDATVSALSDDACDELGRLLASELRGAERATVLALATGTPSTGYAPRRFGAMNVSRNRAVLERSNNDEQNMDGPIEGPVARRRLEAWCAGVAAQETGRTAIVSLMQSLVRALTDCSQRRCVALVRTDGIETADDTVARALRTGSTEALRPVIDNANIAVVRICGLAGRHVRGSRRVPDTTTIAAVLRGLFTDPTRVEISDTCEEHGAAE